MEQLRVAESLQHRPAMGRIRKTEWGREGRKETRNGRKRKRNVKRQQARRGDRKSEKKERRMGK